MMKARKRRIFSALLLALALALAGCAGGSAQGTPAPAPAPGETAAPAAQGGILVAYFSHTGNTREVARQIAALTGGDLAEIRRAQAYENLQEEAEAEILEGARPEITVDVESMENYDVVFVGYPIWWGEAPAMIASFLEAFDFSGKTIVPFCTSASDSIDGSLHIFSELCPDATLAGGLTANDEAGIEPWLRGLGLIA